MPGNVIDLAARRPKREVRRKHGRLPVALQASEGCVRLVIGTHDDGAEVVLTPDAADLLASELTRFARAARGLNPDG